MTLLGDHKSHSSRGLSDEIKQVIDDYYKTKGYCIPESIFNHIAIDHGDLGFLLEDVNWHYNIPAYEDEVRYKIQLLSKKLSYTF
jgi:hypothetical protein